MKRMVDRNHIIKMAKTFDKRDLIVGLVGVDYNWFELSEENEDFFYAYAIVDNNFVEELYLKGSNNGEIWDLELEMNKIDDIDKDYSLYEIELFDKNIFPRAFVLRGVGGSEYFDNNHNRNYVVKKGRGGNLLSCGDVVIKLNHISLYEIFGE